MRLAVISDIHGNLTALEAVIADLRETSPDLVLHGGDLAAGGARPAEIVDRVRALGWSGVLGNTDEMLFRPESLTEFAARSPHLQRLFNLVEDQAAFTRGALGSERIAWLRTLPISQSTDAVALVHASPASAWVSPGAKATDDELDATYQTLGTRIAIYAHIHQPFVRSIGPRIVANTGSVSLSYDGDPRASYLLVDEGSVTIRRVDYDLAAEVAALKTSDLPHADWVAQTLQKASFVMP